VSSRTEDILSDKCANHKWYNSSKTGLLSSGNPVIKLPQAAKSKTWINTSKNMYIHQQCERFIPIQAASLTGQEASLKQSIRASSSGLTNGLVASEGILVANSEMQWQAASLTA
jgi:hypothetical protein